jgi:hypothetical protein
LEEDYAVEITKIGDICRGKGRYTTTDCQKAPTQHQLSSVTDSQMPQDRSTDRNKTNKGEHRRENKKKIVRKEDVWTVAT